MSRRSGAIGQPTNGKDQVGDYGVRNQRLHHLIEPFPLFLIEPLLQLLYLGFVLVRVDLPRFECFLNLCYLCSLSIFSLLATWLKKSGGDGTSSRMVAAPARSA